MESEVSTARRKRVYEELAFLGHRCLRCCVCDLGFDDARERGSWL